MSAGYLGPLVPEALQALNPAPSFFPRDVPAKHFLMIAPLLEQMLSSMAMTQANIIGRINRNLNMLDLISSQFEILLMTKTNGLNSNLLSETQW